MNSKCRGTSRKFHGKLIDSTVSSVIYIKQLKPAYQPWIKINNKANNAERGGPQDSPREHRWKNVGISVRGNGKEALICLQGKDFLQVSGEDLRLPSQIVHIYIYIKGVNHYDIEKLTSLISSLTIKHNVKERGVSFEFKWAHLFFMILDPLRLKNIYIFLVVRSKHLSIV